MSKGKKNDKSQEKTRRVRGEGTVFQRETDGRWVARVPLGGGKRKEEYYDSKQEAERAKRRILNERDAGKLVTARDQTLKQYLEYWLHVQKITVRLTTYSTEHSYMMSYIIPVLGHVRLRKLEAEMFQSLYLKMQESGKSPNTIRHVHTVIKKALGDAVKLKKLTANPLEGVKPPKARKTRAIVLNKAQAECLLKCAKETRLYSLFLMGVLLGMRRGELLGLKWADIDFEQGVLRIERGLSYVSNPQTKHYEFVEGEPKTATSKRLLRLPQVIVNALCEHRTQQLQQKASATRWENKDLVFCTGSGGYLNPGYLRVAFLSLLKKAGLAHMRLHDLRHSARTLLRALGVDPIVIREILGWTSTSQVADDVYGHSLPEMHEEAMDKLDSAFGDKEED